MSAPPDSGGVLVVADRAERALAERLAGALPPPVRVGLPGQIELQSADQILLVVWGARPSSALTSLTAEADSRGQCVVVLSSTSGPLPPVTDKPFLLDGWSGEPSDPRLAALAELVASYPRGAQVIAEPSSSAAGLSGEGTLSTAPGPAAGVPLASSAQELLNWALSLQWDQTPPPWSTRVVLGALAATTDLSARTGIPLGLVGTLPSPAPGRVDEALHALGGRRGSASELPYDVTFDQDVIPSVEALTSRLGVTTVEAHHVLAAALTEPMPAVVLAALGVSQPILRYGLRAEITQSWPTEPAAVWDHVLGPLAGALPADVGVLAVLGWVAAVRESAPSTPLPLAVLLGSLAWAGASLGGSEPAPDRAVQQVFWSLSGAQSNRTQLDLLMGRSFTAVGVDRPTNVTQVEPQLAALTPILHRATSIAVATGAGANPAQRHLVAAALVTGRVPAPLADVLGADDGELRLRLCSAVVELLGEDQQSWTNALGLDRFETRFATDHVPVRRRRPRSEDDPALPALLDHLDVDVYVAMLAATMTRKTTAMPLSIGLFGEWGSGKSYFMELLRQQVDTLSTPSGPTSPYVSSVIQVTFNAWNYADTNLWASLAAEFFEQLGAPEVDPDDARRASVRAELTTQNQVRQELAEIRDAAATRTAKAREAYVDAVAQREVRSRTFSVALLTAVLADAEVSAQLTALSTKLGLGNAPAQTLRLAQDVRALTDDAAAIRQVLGRRSLLVPLLLVVGVLVITAVVAALVPPDAVTRVFGVGALSTVTAVLTSAGVVVSKSRAMLVQLRALADAAQNAQDRVLSDGGPVAELASAIHRAEADEGVAQTRLAELDTTVSQLQKQLDDLQPGRKLYQFIAERAASTEYRGQLGVVSSVRRDFEVLVELMRRWHTSPEAQDSQQPIDRIVLYVDDLDRCEPDQVVQVLQAVHLLLAMDLFIVVVGVDPRWLLRALRQRYRGVLDPESATDTDHGFAASTPQNYLEKIFQIPFVLPRMSTSGFGQLMAALASGGSPDAGDSRDVDRSTVTPATSPAPVGPVPVTAPAPAPAPAPAQPTPDVPVAVPVEAASETAAGLRAADPTVADSVRDIVATPVTRRELELLERLAPLVRTPRSATRLFNLYGILRSATDLSPGRQFLGSPGRPGDYQAVAQLLGVLAADPELLGVILWGRSGDGRPSPLGLCRSNDDGSWFDVVDGLRPQQAEPDGPWSNAVADVVPATELDRWVRLTHELTALRDTVTLTELGPYRLWGPQISRFSFLLSPFAADA